MRLRAAGLICRLTEAFFSTVPFALWKAPHLFFWPSAMLFRADALIVRRGVALPAVAEESLLSSVRISAILVSSLIAPIHVSNQRGFQQ